MTDALLKVAVYGENQRVGLVDAGAIYDVNALARACPGGAAKADALTPPNLAAFIAAGPAGLAFARDALAWGREHGASLRQPLASAGLRAPWPGLRICAAGGNFVDHLVAGMASRGLPMTPDEAFARVRGDEPLGYWKLPTEAAGPEDGIEYPARCDRLDYEGELAIVIGRRGKDIPRAEALSYVWGVTCFNDWSIRKPNRPGWFPFSLGLLKNFDGATSIGPWIAAGGLDPENLRVQLRVNGRTRQDFSTADMIYSFTDYIEFLSRDFTLLPGDMIVSGTAKGTAADQTAPDAKGYLKPDLFLNIGDVVEVEVPEIGVLRNRIVAKRTG